MLDDTTPRDMPRWVPITVGKLRTLFADESLRIVRQGKLPSAHDLEQLAESLNSIAGAFRRANEIAKPSKQRASKVKAAIDILTQFFEARREACCQKGNLEPSPEIIEAERALYNKFQDFIAATREHDFQLDMDVCLLMPNIDSWRHLATTVASGFIAVMKGTSGGARLGLSNDGPVPRFVAAVIPLITGETPSVWNVGKHLKDKARAARKRTGTSSG